MVLDPNNIQIKRVSEDCLQLLWALPPSALPTAELAAQIGALSYSLLQSHPDKIVNAIPAYQSLLIQWDPLAVSESELHDLVHALLDEIGQTLADGVVSGELHRIPVFYDPRVGMDLESLCQSRSIDIEELVQLHTGQVYSVFAVGFLPGFAYLGYVPPALEMPRHESFKSKLPGGSVGIADRQTAVYPSESPGGWQIIGRTPLPMLIDGRARLRTGDRVQFVSISEQEFLEQGGELEVQAVDD